MKTILSTTIAAALLAVSAMPVQAAPAKTTPANDWVNDLHPYIGADYQRTHIDYNNNYDVGGGLALNGNRVLDNNLNGFNLHAGIRPHKNFGLELGYFRTENASKNIAAGTSVGPGTVAAGAFSTRVRVQGATLDALGYLPVDDKDTVDLIGTAGVSYNWAKSTLVVPGVGTGSDDDSEVGFRIGGGAQVNVVDNVNLRALVRYQTADFDDVADNAWVYTVGANFSF